MKMVYANLDSLIVKKAVPEQAKLDILRQVAKGLKFLHVEHKVAHADLRPENILVREQTNYLSVLIHNAIDH